MFIQTIRLDHYRNYDFLEIELDKGTNLFIGDNAQGKTNILEAVYVCGTSRSHRTNKDKDLIAFGCAESHIRMFLQKGDLPYQIDFHLHKDRPKGIAVNGQPIRRARDLLGISSMVFFSPEDLNIIKEGPSLRRKFLDAELCQLDPLYLSDLAEYNKVVNQRNKLLKDAYGDEHLLSTLDVWDAQLLRYGKKIIKARSSFIEEMIPFVQEIHGDLTGGLEKLTLSYEPDVTEEGFEKKLSANREKDKKMKTTSVGPHRDDIAIFSDGIDLRQFGSQGQQRTAALTLKLSEISMIKRKRKETPVLLLDDVLSELDKKRQAYLLERIHNIQTLITCTGMDEFKERSFGLDRIFHISQGTAKLI